MPTPLDDLSNVKQVLGITTSDDDDLLEELQTMADESITQVCGRTFTGGTFTEYFAGGERLLFLTNYPISAITSVKVDPAGVFGAETVRDPETYVLHADRGVVEKRSGSFGVSGEPRSVQVIYTTAADAVPPPVARASAELIGFWYRQVKTAVELGQLNLLSRNESGVETRYGSLAGKVPEAVREQLAIYRVPTV